MKQIRIKEGQSLFDKEGNEYQSEKGDVLIGTIKKLQESNHISISVVYVSGTESITKEYTERNYKDIDKIEKALQDTFESDDYGIDSIWVEGGNFSLLNLDWVSILTTKGLLNTDLVDAIFEEDSVELFVKMEFCSEENYDITPDRLEELTVYKAHNDFMVEGQYGSVYPQGVVDDLVEIFYPDLLKALKKANGESYFDWGKLLSDNEINGVFKGSNIDDYFVYTFNV
jgi:hypothetical protein